MAQQIKQPLIPWLGHNSFITEDLYIKGGFRCVPTKRARDQIPLSSRKAGMMVYCLETDTHYKLKLDLATWQTFTGQDVVVNPAGGSGGVTASVISSLNAFVTIALKPQDVNVAPTYVGAGVAIGSSSGEISPLWPVGHLVNDVALLFVETAGGQAVTLSTASSFVELPNSPQFTGLLAAGTRLSVFWSRATSTTMLPPVIADPGDHIFAQIVTYRGVINTGNPWDVTGGGIKDVASTSVTLPGVITTVANTRIVQAVSRNVDTAAAAFTNVTNENLTAVTERIDGGTLAGNGGGFVVWDGVKTQAGATGNTTGGNGAVGIQIQQIADATTITQDNFSSAAVCAFDFTNCPEAPNYDIGNTTSIVGLNMSTDGSRIAQLAISVLGGTPTVYFRTKADTNAAWSPWKAVGEASGSSGAPSVVTVTMASHPFSVNSVVAIDPTGAYIAGKADNAATAEVVGICTAVVDADHFEMTLSGRLVGIYTNLVPGTTYFLSAGTAGNLQAAAPTTPGYVSKPLLTALTANIAYLNIQRGVVVPTPLLVSFSLNLDTSGLAGSGNLITLPNNSGASNPHVQVQDTTGLVRHDVLITVTEATLVFNFGNVTTPTGIWKAVIVG